MTQAPPFLAVAIVTALVAVSLIRAGLFVLERPRGSTSAYFDRSKPPHVRNLPFAQFALGLGGIAFLLVFPVQYVLNEWRWPVSLVLLAGATFSGYLAAGWLMRPPDMLKPAWVRRREVGESAGFAGTPPDVRRLLEGLRVVALVATTIFGAAALLFALGIVWASL